MDPSLYYRFAIKSISYEHFEDYVVITIETFWSCHLSIHYTQEEVRKHPQTIVRRGVELPWGVYFCFTAYLTLEQQEDGDTTIHTFTIEDWQYCQTFNFIFTGTFQGIEMHSCSPIYSHHHPGIPSIEVFICRTTDGDIRTPTHIYDYIEAHDGTRARVIDTSDYFSVGQQFTNSMYLIYRGGLFFDTSPLTEAAIVLSATIYFRTYAVYGTGYLIVCVSGDTLREPLIVENYYWLLPATQSLGSCTPSSPWLWSALHLNALGLEKINKKGITQLALRTDKDIDTIAPTAWEHTRIYAAESARKPYLHVTFTRR